MYVNMKYILDNANRDGYAVMAVNSVNMEMARAVIEAAEEEHSPIIVQFGVGQLDYRVRVGDEEHWHCFVVLRFLVNGER